MNASYRFTDEQVIDIRQRLLKGDSTTLLAGEFQTSREYMRQVKNNIIRKGIGPDASKAIARSHQNRRRALELRSSGMTRSQVARTLGLSVATVSIYTMYSKGRSWPRQHQIVTLGMKAEMRSLYATGDYTQEMLAEMFGITQTMVSRNCKGIKKGSKVSC